MIEGACHCRSVSVGLEKRPASLTDCNCSLCRRIGALWAYCRPNQHIRGPTVGYVQGERTLDARHCGACVCTTHWISLDPASDRMAVNARLFAPETLQGVVVRRFDGAGSWTYLDEP